jgi:hypothetical protein
MNMIELTQQRWSVSDSGKNSCKFAEGNIWDYIWRNANNKNVKKNDDASRLFINKPMEYIENLCALASDTPVDMIIYPERPEYDIDAMIYQQSVKWVRNNNQDEEIREQMQKFAMLEGTGVYKVWFEPRKFQGQFIPWINYTAIDPKYVKVDPMARNSKEIQYVIQLCMYTKSELKRLYPKFDAESNDSVSVQTADEFESYNSPETGTDSEMVKVWEHWTLEGDKNKYPFGRFYVCTENQELADEPNKYECVFPFVFIPFISIPDRVFGRDLYTYLRDMSDVLNRNMKRMEQIIYKNAYGNMIVDTSAGINATSVTNEDCQVIGVKRNAKDAVIQLPGPPLNNSPIQFGELMERYMRDIAGVQDITLGKANINAGTPSGTSLEKLDQLAQTRLRQFVRNIIRGYKQLSEKIVSITHQFFDAESVVRITGGDVQEVKNILERDKAEALNSLMRAGAKSKEEIEEGMKIYEKTKKADVKHGDSNTAYMTFKGDNLGDPNIFVLDCQGGVNIAHKKLDTANQAMMLKQTGDIDPQTFMEAIDFPLKEKALQRNQQWQMFQQWMAQMAEQKKSEDQAKRSISNKKAKEALGEDNTQGNPVDPAPGNSNPMPQQGV